jgi:hypothetical protein
MYNVDVYKLNENAANISQLPIKREWMEKTVDSHAYKCFPVTLTNSLGWGLSFPEDISFIWDGVSDTYAGHVKVLQGEKYVTNERSNATISFNTGLVFKTKQDVSILQIPVPNLFLDGVSPFSTIISTSFFSGPLPSAWRITKPNSVITIKANTPFISIIPISLTQLQNSTVTVMPGNMLDQKLENLGEDYSNAISELNMKGRWSNFYRDATDHKGNSLGSHEVKAIRLNTVKYEQD